MKKLGIIGAMSVEVEHLKAKLTDISCKTVAGMDFYEGILEGQSVVIVVCGVGKVNAALCAQALCNCFSVTHIVNTGIAGSLCAELDIGDFVISSDAMYHDFTCQGLNPAYKVGQVPDLPVHTFAADETLQTLARNAAEKVYPGHSRVGRIASGDQFVSDPAQKDTIIANTGALCTEMEGAAIAHAAWKNGIPFVILRAISDKADGSAHMDYPTFEALASQRSAAVTAQLAKELSML